MSWWQYLVLAMVQGIAEILPISSSAHLQITRAVLLIQEPSLTFDVALHFASALAVIVFYWKRLWQLAYDFLAFIGSRKEQYFAGFRYVLMIILATIPAGLAGVLLQDFIGSLFSSLVAVGLFLMVTGTLLVISPLFKGNKPSSQMTLVDALVIGAFQSFGLFPGISRSGITLMGTKVRHIDPKDAAEFVFILFIPIALAAGILELPDLFALGIGTDVVWIVLATLLSGVMTYFSLRTLLSIVRKGKVYYFGYYCLVIGVLVAMLSMLSVI